MNAPAWDRLSARLYPFVRRRVACDADADDVLQDVLLRMHRGLGSLEDEARMGAWMFRIARTAIADHQRRRARHPLLAQAPGVEPEAPLDDDDRAVATLVSEYLAVFVAQLPSPYREAITLTELSGKSHKEAAEMLGVSLTCMKSRVQRGRAKLRELLDEQCDIVVDSRGKIVSCEPRSNGCEC